MLSQSATPSYQLSTANRTRKLNQSPNSYPRRCPATMWKTNQLTQTLAPTRLPGHIRDQGSPLGKSWRPTHQGCTNLRPGQAPHGHRLILTKKCRCMQQPCHSNHMCPRIHNRRRLHPGCSCPCSGNNRMTAKKCSAGPCCLCHCLAKRSHCI